MFSVYHRLKNKASVFRTILSVDFNGIIVRHAQSAIGAPVKNSKIVHIQKIVKFSNKSKFNCKKSENRVK